MPTHPTAPPREQAAVPVELPDALDALALETLNRSTTPGDWAGELAQQLCMLATQARENYLRLLPADGPPPTAAQGVALARLLRSRFDQPNGQATVIRGGIDLPHDYVHVLFPDGYEAGIDPQGTVST